MDTYLVGEAVSPGDHPLEVRSPYSGEVVDVVHQADENDVERVLAASTDGAAAMRALAAHERSSILETAAKRIEAEADELAAIIVAEQGKPLQEAKAEAARIPGIVRLCAEEARRISGEVLPMDAEPVGVNRFGYTHARPSGVVAAVSPFNYPAILSIHKIGPALAAGNAVIAKPASATPLSTLFMARWLLEAGLPPLALQVVVGPGSTLGQAIVGDDRVRRVSFTGSYEVGVAISRAAGPKPVTCELGSNAAVVILDDADIDLAARAVAFSGYVNAGQVCVSAQRVIVDGGVRDEFLQALLARVASLRTGDPADAETTLGPLTSRAEADRIAAWTEQAVADGGELIAGGARNGSVIEPMIVLEPPDNSNFWSGELFGPGVGVKSVNGVQKALAEANRTPYGLAATVMTRDIDRALHLAHSIDAGVINVNSPEAAHWRADFMPWGGLGKSGFGREGVRYAVREMTEDSLIVIHSDQARRS